jgi:hypothetical protein
VTVLGWDGEPTAHRLKISKPYRARLIASRSVSKNGDAGLSSGAAAVMLRGSTAGLEANLC